MSVEKDLAVALELSERRRLESQRLSGVGFWEFHHQRKTLYWSEEVFAIYGFCANAFEPDYEISFSLVHEDDRERVEWNYLDSVESGNEYSIRHRIKTDAGDKWIEARGVTLYDEQGLPERSIGTARDISEIVDAQRAAEYLASHDALTGLPNRTLFFDRITMAMRLAKRNQQSIAVLFIDLDNFKLINDRHGHEIGDQVLVGVANRLCRGIRASDTFARIGGDEFVGVLNISDEPSAEAAVERVQEVLQGRYETQVGEFEVTASIGVTIYPLDCDEPDALLRHADHAMYEAKERGKARIRFFDAGRHLSNVHRSHLLGDIENAIANDEFQLYFQPRVSLRDGSMAGAEALLRWFRPEGPVSPAKVIEAITGTALAWELDRWVLRALLRHHARFLEHGVAGPYSFNVNPCTLENPGLPALLAEVLGEAGVAGEHFEIEILEVSSIGDFEKASASLMRCKALGFSFSLDDFGTGYSSLTHFHALPIDKLKIDQHFVKRLLSDESSMTLVKSILAIARANRTPTVAEGIESFAIARALLDLGCEYGQGYGLAMPMAAQDYLHCARTWDPGAFLAQLRTADRPGAPPRER